MLQYKIPQNVGIEDKIVGPLTLRQLIILAVGGGISYSLFLILSKMYELNFIEYAVIAVPALFAVAAALVRINDIAFLPFILLTVEYNMKPKKRVWDHRGISALVAPDLGDTAPEEKETLPLESKRKNVNLSQLSQVLDSGGFNHVNVKEHPDMDRARDEDLITQAFFGTQSDPAQQMYWRSMKHDQGRRLELLAKLPATPLKKPEEKKVTLVAALTTPPAPLLPAVALKTPLPAPLAAPPLQAPASPVPSLPSEVQKKRRRRKKKKGASSLRPGTEVNTLKKDQPVQFPPKKEKNQAGEFEFHELERGEIEINLD